MRVIKNYLSLVKFSHTIFALPFAFIGFFLAIKFLKVPETFVPGWHTTIYPAGYLENNIPVTLKEYGIRLALVILCMVFARSAAMAFNRYLDRKIDALNPRTAVREVPKGIITPQNALLFTIVCCLLFIGTTYFINSICFYLSPVALLVVLGYSYTKRFTSLCHLVLGLGLSLAPIGAYLAVTGAFNLLPLLFSFAVIFWVSGFDIIYALQDEEFDKAQQLNSIPARVGKKRALGISELLHLLSLGFVVFAGKAGHFGPLYWLGVLVFGGMLLYQHSIVKYNDLRRVNVAFMTANGIASVVFAVFVIADLLIN
ncbi:MAG: UbiA-like polyprenyltransferase [Chitinophagaceae bacterium]